MIKISKELEKELRDIYLDCLILKGLGNLTEFGEGELSVLEEIF